MNETQFCISPIKFLLIKIYCESIWPINIWIDNYFSCAAVHSCPFYSRCFTPVSPIHVSEKESRGAQKLNHNKCWLALGTEGMAALCKACECIYIERCIYTNVYPQNFNILINILVDVNQTTVSEGAKKVLHESISHKHCLCVMYYHSLSMLGSTWLL